MFRVEKAENEVLFSRDYKVFVNLFQKVAGNPKGQRPFASPVAKGEIPKTERRIFGGELKNIPVGYFSRGPFLKEKRGLLCFPKKQIAVQRGNPRRGFPLENSPLDYFLTLSCVLGSLKIPLSAESGQRDSVPLETLKFFEKN